MEIILKEDFPSLGYVGDRVKVRPGYARNFLLPRGIAVEASVRNARLLKHRLTAIGAKRIKLRAQAEEYAKTIGTMVLEFTLKGSDKGRSFGSITTRDIEQAMKTQGVALDRRQLRIVDPIRGAGDHAVEVKLHSEVTALVKVRVAIDAPKKEAAPAEAASAEGEEGAEGKKGRGRKRSAKAEDSATEDATSSEAEAAE